MVALNRQSPIQLPAGHGQSFPLSLNAKTQLIITARTYKKDYCNPNGVVFIPYLLITMSSPHSSPDIMDFEEAYQALLGLILAAEPNTQGGLTWDRIAVSFTVTSPDQRHINYLVEAASNQLLAQLTDTLCRMFNMATLPTEPFQGYVAAIAALPQRAVELRMMRGAEFCEAVRRMVEERWMVGEAVPSWDVIMARREAELEVERRALVDVVSLACGEGLGEM